MTVNGNIAVSRSVLPDGVAGVDATVKKVVEMAHGVYGSKSAKIRALSIDILRAAGIPDKDYYGEIVATHNWVRDNIRYVHDPIGQETLSFPEETAFNSKAGDCDDMVILEIAMLGSIGVEAYPVVCGMFPGHYSHIYLHARVPEGRGRNAGKIIPLDPIMKDWQAGREATQIKSKKMYPDLSNPLTMNGLPMSGLGDIGDLGAYAIAPSYLDQENAHAGELLISDNASNVHRDGTVAIGTQVSMPASGIDGMFCGGMGNDVREAFSSTSAGDDGTIVQSGGQLVPKGFIRNGPDLAQVMAMDPSSASRLGPRGPIFANSAAIRRDSLTAANRDSRISFSAEPITDVKGIGRYEMPMVGQALQKNLSRKPRTISTKQPTRTVRDSIVLDRISAKARPATVGEMLAEAENELASTLPAMQIAAQRAAQPQALHYKESWRKAGVALNQQAKMLESKVLKLRQIQRDLSATSAPAQTVRAAAVTTQQNRVVAHQFRPRPAPVNGLGTFMDTIKQPIVWGPALAFVGVLALMYLKKRRSAATA